MEPDQQKVYKEQIEKVADKSITLEPSSEVSIEISLNKEIPNYDLIAEKIAKLQIVNIRVIKKIERYCRDLQFLFGSDHSFALKQAIESSILFIYSKLQPNVAPSLNFLKKYNRTNYFIAQASNQAAQDPNENKWVDVLNEYPYYSTDEYDLLLIRNIELGIVDDEELNKCVEIYEKRNSNSQNEQNFHNAWNLYHDSFDLNDEEVLDNFKKIMFESPEAISPANFSNAIVFLKEMGQADVASELIINFVNKREEPRSFWNLKEYPWREDITDKELVEAFASKLLSIPDDRDPADVLVSMGKNKGYNPTDIAYLASLDEQTFYAIFKSHNGAELRRAVQGGLMFYKDTYDDSSN